MTQNSQLELLAVFHWPQQNDPLVIPVLEKLAVASRREEGCLEFELFFGAAKSKRAVAVERWSDRKSWETHLSDTAVRTAKMAFKQHLVEVEVKLLAPTTKTGGGFN